MLSNQQCNINEWILLISLLTIVIVIFIILFAIYVNQYQNRPVINNCFGKFGIQSSLDADPINLCGQNRTEPCVFSVNNLTDAQSMCNELNCNAFTLNLITSTMKIVDPNNDFNKSTFTNLFVRQDNCNSIIPQT